MSLIRGIKSFVADINHLIVSLLLFLTYVLAVGFTALLSKLVGKHFLDKSKKETYWSDLKLENKLEELYRQY